MIEFLCNYGKNLDHSHHYLTFYRFVGNPLKLFNQDCNKCWIEQYSCIPASLHLLKQSLEA